MYTHCCTSYCRRGSKGSPPPSPVASPPPMQGFAHTLLITLSERGCMNWPKELPKPGAGSREGGWGDGRGESWDREGGLHELLAPRSCLIPVREAGRGGHVSETRGGICARGAMREGREGGGGMGEWRVIRGGGKAGMGKRGARSGGGGRYGGAGGRSATHRGIHRVSS